MALLLDVLLEEGVGTQAGQHHYGGFAVHTLWQVHHLYHAAAPLAAVRGRQASIGMGSTNHT